MTEARNAPRQVAPSGGGYWNEADRIWDLVSRLDNHTLEVARKTADLDLDLVTRHRLDSTDRR